MNSNCYACVCCGCRLTKTGRRPVTAKSMQLFVAIRLFPSHFANDGYICNKCRLMYIKWKALPEFNEFLTMIDDSHQITNTTMDDISNEGASDDDCMDAENSTNQSVNETLSDNESMDDDDDDPDDGQTVNES